MRKREKQRYFDKALTHLRAQGQRAYDDEDSMCLYRGKDGLKCAIGALIPDEKYDSEWEGDGADNVMERVLGRQLKSHDTDRKKDERAFFNDMQHMMHDTLGSDHSFAMDLEQRAASFAHEFGLEFKGQ